MKEVRKIPKAQQAVNEEWNKLRARGSWEVTKVKSKAILKMEAQLQGRTIHFGSLMDLCHLKHSELAPEFQKYKGRVVFRGDIVRDEHDFYAVFF